MEGSRLLVGIAGVREVALVGRVKREVVELEFVGLPSLDIPLDHGRRRPSLPTRALIPSSGSRPRRP
jgi:hypothetical protein